MRNGTSRRRFLVLASSVGAAALLGPRALGALEASFTERLEERLSGLFRETESVRFVGLEYLRAAPEENSVDALIGSLAAGVEGGRRTLETTSGDGMRALLARRMRDDFGAGETVELRGWILSRTEVRLAAIAALIGGGP